MNSIRSLGHAEKELILLSQDFAPKLEFNVGLGSDPKTFPIRIANSTASLEVKKFVLDFKSIVGLKNNDQLTVQVIEVSSDGVKYGCVDVTASL